MTLDNFSHCFPISWYSLSICLFWIFLLVVMYLWLLTNSHWSTWNYSVLSYMSMLRIFTQPGSNCCVHNSPLSTLHLWDIMHSQLFLPVFWFYRQLLLISRKNSSCKAMHSCLLTCQSHLTSHTLRFTSKPLDLKLNQQHDLNLFSCKVLRAHN